MVLERVCSLGNSNVGCGVRLVGVGRAKAATRWRYGRGRVKDGSGRRRKAWTASLSSPSDCRMRASAPGAWQQVRPRCGQGGQGDKTEVARDAAMPKLGRWKRRSCGEVRVGVG